MTEENRAVVFTLLQKIENQPDRLQENTLLWIQTGPPPEMCCRGPEGARKMLRWPTKCESGDLNWLNLIFITDFRYWGHTWCVQGHLGGSPVKDFRRMERSWALFLLFLFWQQHYILGGINKWMMVNFHFILPEPKISIWWIYSCCTCIYYRLVFHISYACSQGHKENSCWERVVGFLSFEPLFLCFDSSYEHPRPSYSPQQPVCAHADQWPFTLRPLDDFCNV